MRHLSILGLLSLSLLGAAAPPPVNLDRALASQRQLLLQEPLNAQAQNDLGNLLLLAGDPSGAQEAYQQALVLEPRLVSAHYNLALLALQNGELRVAHDHLQEALKLQPSHAWAWFQLGRVEELRGRDNLAVQAYWQAFDLDPMLTFDDVNPQLIDSELVTEALLAAPFDRATATQAARSYEEPGRIAALLLPQVPSGSAPAAAGEADSVGRQGAESAAPTRDLPPAADAPGGRVLRPQDLESGSQVGEATPAGGDARGGWEADRRSPSTTILRQRGETPASGRVQERAPGTAAPRSGYRPGSRSSGQIDNRLRPNR